MASHLLYTQVLDDNNAAQRKLGIEAGLAWSPCSDATVAYVDRGISPGMRLGIERTEREGRPVETRHLTRPSWQRTFRRWFQASPVAR